MSEKLFSVAETVVVVSGASRGIGLAIAESFAMNGAKVVITGRDHSRLAEAKERISVAPHSVTPIVCNVSQSRAVKSLVEQVLETLGQIDTLVNCAGVNLRKPALEMTEKDYDFILDVNLKGAFLLSLEVGRHMVRQKRGSQINIASLSSDRPLTNLLPYSMSKAALVQMTRGLAHEWGEHGVRVNALAPGFILTDLTRKLWSDSAMKEWAHFNTPQRRLGEPRDLIGTALFLASEASEFVTGQTLYVDGGFRAAWSWPIPAET